MNRGRVDERELEFVRDSIVTHETALERDRQRLYRLHLQVTVREVSPLVLDLAAYTGSRFDEVLADFAPRSSWPDSDLSKVRGKGSSQAGARNSGYPLAALHKNQRRGVVRGGAASGGQVVFMVLASRIEAMASIGGCAIQTIGDHASLVMPDALPETIAAALPGRPVDALVRHPVLDGRNYVVQHVNPGFSGGDVVTFRTGMLPCTLPWRELLDAEMERGL